jgi:arylsulfatase A-like enzyme/Tfp pilus assembly protein PilF
LSIRRATVTGLCYALAAGLLACGSSAPLPSEAQTTGPSVLLITIDTLRWDRADRDGPMPRLRRLASRGTSFSRAFAEVPLTLPSHATILTGAGPEAHGVRDNIGFTLPRDLTTVTVRFQEAGYATGAFLGGYPLVRGRGLERGFDRYDDRMTRAPEGAASGHTERRGAEVVRSALDWIRSRNDGPFFAWVHLFDPHEPYEAPAPFAGRHPLPYDDEAAYTDHVLGQLLDGIGSLGRSKTTWIVVAADHGESLGEHGERTHGVFLYGSTLHVPLIVVGPEETASRSSDVPVSLADVGPTLLDAAGLPPLPSARGRSLLPILRSGDVKARKFYLESIHGRRRYGWAPLYGYLDWPLKYVEAPDPEVYDLARDPAETENLFRPEEADELADELARLRGRRPQGPEPLADPADLERLAALGYVGGTAAPASQETLDDRPRPDPKERIGAIATLERGLEKLRAGDLDSARRDLAAAQRRDPGNLVALNNLGIVALRKGELESAESLFRRTLEGDPAAENVANNLGLTLSRSGRPAEAIPFYRRALDVRPGFTAARFNLALALHRLGRHAEALQELGRVSREEPEFPRISETIREVERSASETPLNRTD